MTTHHTTQSRMIASEQNLIEKEYWMNKFSGDLVRSYFPYDFPLANLKGDVGHDALTFSIPSELAARMNAVSNGSDVRLFIVIATGLVALLNKYTDNTDVTIGVPIYKQEAEGEYINTALALRSQFTEDMSFKQLLLALSSTVLEANAHQNYSLNSLLYNLGIQDIDGPFPLFDVAVLLENIHRAEDIAHTRPNLVFSFAKTADGIEGRWTFHSALYEKSTIERIRNHFLALLGVALFNLDIALRDVEILSEGELDFILRAVNDTAAAFPDGTIHQAIEAQVERTPDSIALIEGSRQWTYQELNAKANQLARLLQDKGTGVESIVAVMFDRSADMVVTLLAVLKAGAAYMPIDPDSPYERISSLLEDCGASLLLTNSRTLNEQGAAERTYSLNGTEVLCVDQLDSELAARSIENPESAVQPDHLAYVLYTSGSTGKPKGVMVEHRNAMNVLDWFIGTSGLQAGDRVVLSYDYTSDPSIEDIFATWMCGAVLHVTDKFLLLERDRFRAFVKEHRISILNFVPRIIQELLCDGEKLESLHTVLSGGEVLENTVKDELLAIGYRVFNDYGPTEAAVDCLSQACSERNVTIGRPIRNMKCYVLDARNRIKPIGVPGELCIAGVGVARGYLNRAELTAEKFVPNPFVEGDRMYRTGDLARLLPNGEIEFLGRFDHQVKIRGYRVELGEIEHAIMKFESVKEVYVMAKEDEHREKWICAYVVPDGDLTLSDLKWYLTQKLPDYMIPKQLIPVDDIPLNPNGKVNVKALPEPAADMASEAALYKPETDMEKTVAQIWMDVLGSGPYGIHSNYFEIGGHSMNIIQVRAKILERLGQDVSVVTLFQYSTIQSLARYLNGEIGGPAAADDSASAVEQMDETLDILRGFTS